MSEIEQKELRPAAITDFHVIVEGVGSFRFARRTMRDEMNIAVEFSRLTHGIETPSPTLHLMASWISTLTVLTVSAPEGWDIYSMDPLDDATYSRLLAVHSALRAKEDDFRGRGK